MKKPHCISSDQITNLETFLVAPRWLFIKIETQAGLVGWGEGTLEGRSNVVASEIENLKRFVIGSDPENISFIIQQIIIQPFYHTDSVLRSALSAIDIALWDIKGKRYGVPISCLLGGVVNETIRCYRWFGGNIPQADGSDQQESAVTMLNKLMQDRDPNEINYFKMNACGNMGNVDTDGGIDRAKEVLASLYSNYKDKKVKIGIDCHGRLRPGSARQFLRMVEEFSDLVLFVEEPLPVEEIDSMYELRNSTSMRLATGERFYLPNDFARLGSNKCADIFQPDLGHCGGISSGRQIADIANTYGLGFAPHCPNGPILLAASLQVQAYTPSSMLQETSIGIHYNGNRDAGWYLKNSEVLTPDKGGLLKIPMDSGLGIEVDEEKVREAAEVGITWDESGCYLFSRIGGCPQPW